MEQNTGEVVVNDNQQEAAVEINMTELVAGEEPTASEQQEQPQVQTEPPQRKETQNFDRAFSERLKSALKSERRKFEQGEEYQLGSQLIKARSAKDGVSTEDAVKLLKKEFYDELDPNVAVRLMMEQSQSVPQEPTAHDRSMELAEQVTQAVANGILPSDFMPTQEFTQNAIMYGVEAAAKIYAAQSIATTASKVDQARKLPKSIAPNNNVGSTTPDFGSMSSKKFKEYYDAARKATNSGKRVPFT